MATLGTLAAGIKSVSATRLSEVYITELDSDDLPLVAGGAPKYRRLQYFPDSISDTKQVTYQPKEVPGGSLPIYQFVGAGERNISFTAYFTTDVDHLVAQQSLDFDASGGASFGDQTLPIGASTRQRSIESAVEGMQARLKASGVQGRNPFIPSALVWLRSFMFPRYGENAEVGVPITEPPHKLMLHITGSEIERFGGEGSFSAGGGGILCVMTQCDINIEAFFPSGNIRIASVGLAFSEVPQRGGVIRFPSASGMDTYVENLYKLVASPHSTSSAVTSR